MDQFVQNAKSKKWEIDKDPGATLDYIENWAAWLDAVSDSLVNHTVTITGSAEGSTAAKQSSIINGKTVVVWISGGVHGETITADFRVVTAAGRIDERRCYLKVKER